jgi:endonuclease/exonuclease/phosphatase family metal-dependent hydrolase
MPWIFRRLVCSGKGLLVVGAVLAMAILADRAKAETLAVVSFNVESDRDTDPSLVGEEIAKISSDAKADLFGLAEVRDEADLAVFAAAANRPGATFESILAGHGEQDRVALLYNARALELREVFEMDRFPGSRKALVGRFRHRSAGVEFLFVVNHFNRRDTDRRNRQARLIRDWVLAQDLPAILVGDHNFDYDPVAKRGNEAFRIFTGKKGLAWVQPGCVAKGACPKTGTQCDARYNSIMDFVLVADQGRGWDALSEVLFADRADYCERERRGYADHRPVLAWIGLR